jgi:hypothetical protein
MKIILFLFILVISVFAQNLKNFDWLVGEWHFNTGKKIFVEKWQKVSDKTFEGVSYSIKKESNDTTFAENLRLLEMSGDIFYLPYVNHNPRPIAFKLISTELDSMIFENKDHDFPTRIIYIKQGKDAFIARVEGTRKGKKSAFELYFKRKL